MDRFIFLFRISDWAISLKNCLNDLVSESKKVHRRMVWEYYQADFKKTLGECLTGSLAMTETDLNHLFYQLGQISQMITANVDTKHLTELRQKVGGLIVELLKVGALESCDESEADFILKENLTID